MSKKIDSYTKLRGISVLFVSLFHMFPHRIKGGFLGVMVFFVLSGFLMARKTDDVQTDKVYIFQNFLKRFKRLYPPMVFALFASLIFTYFFANDVFYASYKNIYGILLSLDNIFQIFKQNSYFEMHGNFSMYFHMWTISIQLQFLVIFFAIEYVFYKYQNLKKYKTRFYLALSAASALLMISMSFFNMDINRIYYGTDTRLFSFSLGAAAYSLVGYFTKNIEVLKQKYKLTEKANFVLMFAIGAMLVIMAVFVSGTGELTYRVVIPVFTLLCALLTMLLYNDNKDIFIHKNHVLKIVSDFFMSIFKYLGQRSYHIYIWQYISNKISIYFAARTGFNFYAAVFFGAVLTVIAAEGSYQFFDNPSTPDVSINSVFMFCLGASFVFAFLPPSKTNQMQVYSQNLLKTQQEIMVRNEAGALEKKDSDKSLENQAKYNEEAVSYKSVYYKPSVGVKTGLDLRKRCLDKILRTAYPPFKYEFSPEELEFLKTVSVTAVGDSVIINADSYLRDYFKNYYLDAKVSRHMFEAKDIIKKIKTEKGLGDCVVVALGVNSEFKKPELEEILQVVGEKKLILVNCVMPDPWENSVNKTMAEFCAEHENAYLANWYGAAKKREELFVSDKTHPQPEGAELYAGLIAQTVLDIYR